MIPCGPRTRNKAPVLTYSLSGTRKASSFRRTKSDDNTISTDDPTETMGRGGQISVKSGVEAELRDQEFIHGDGRRHRPGAT